VGVPICEGVGVGSGGTWPNSVEDDVASVEFELRREEDCWEDEETWALDCEGIEGAEAVCCCCVEGRRAAAVAVFVVQGKRAVGVEEVGGGSAVAEALWEECAGR
jgi:hypothetical protein